MPAHINIVGQKFGRLLVISLAESAPIKKWLCRCDCGNEKQIPSGPLKNGATKSCGCLQKETIRKTATTHGMSKTKEYMCWQAMLARCNGYNEDTRENYVERGIKVCKGWRDSFVNFYKDMGKRPSTKHTIERKNNNAGYNKANCMWAIRKIQQRNTRFNRIIEVNGVKKCLSEWCEIHNKKPNCVKHRIYVLGFSTYEALTMPIGFLTHKKIEIGGILKSITEWAKEYNIKEKRVRSRITRGWNPKDAITTPIKK